MGLYRDTKIDHDGRMMCKKGHARTVAYWCGSEDESWVYVMCETCKQTLFYNGA